MNRYDIILGKKPPPPKPKPKKAKVIVTPNLEQSDNQDTVNILDQIFGEDTQLRGIGFGDRIDQSETPNYPRTTASPTLNRNEIIGQYIRTSEGRARLAASMIAPLRNRLDHRSLARRILQVDQLPDGALAQYDFNRDGTYIINDDGQDVTNLSAGASSISPRYVHVPLFEVASNPEIPFTQIRERRFDLIERAQDLAVAEISRAEDSRVIQLLDAVATGNRREFRANRNVLDNSGTAEAIFEDAFDTIIHSEPNSVFTSNGVTRPRVSSVLLNAINYTPLRRYSFLEQERQASVLRDGLLATIWGARIIVSRVIPANQIYIVAPPQVVGRMPIRTDLTVLSADNPENHTIGWSIFENIGMLCNNPFSIAKITLS